MAKEIIKEDLPIIKELLQTLFGNSNYTRLERMGGLTNRTYTATIPASNVFGGGTYVIRIPGEGTEELIDRSNEKRSTELACRIGIDAPLYYFGENGTKVTCYIAGAQTMTLSTMGSTENIYRAAHILRQLHTCGEDTGVSFEVFDMIATYEKIIRNYNIPLFDDYELIRAQIMSIKHHVDANGTPSKVPCHNDALCENWVLDHNGRMYLIDWEYAGMNDFMWDLADVSIEANFTPQQDTFLLEAYLDRSPTAKERERFHANKLYLDLLWTLWGKARVPFDGDEMEAYALERYLRLKKNILGN